MNRRRAAEEALVAAWGYDFRLGEKLDGGAVSTAFTVSRGSEAFVFKHAALSQPSMRWQDQLLHRLGQAGLRAPELMPARDGRLTAGGYLLMTFVEGAPPATSEDWLLVKGYLEQLHAIGPVPYQRPGAASVVGMNAGERPAGLLAVPAEVRDLMLRAWKLLDHQRVGVIHGDPNAGNARLGEAGVALIDWEEARVDYLALDVAGLPDADRRSDGYVASVAWEAFLFWETNRSYAERRLVEVGATLG